MILQHEIAGIGRLTEKKGPDKSAIPLMLTLSKIEELVLNLDHFKTNHETVPTQQQEFIIFFVKKIIHIVKISVRRPSCKIIRSFHFQSMPMKQI